MPIFAEFFRRHRRCVDLTSTNERWKHRYFKEEILRPNFPFRKKKVIWSPRLPTSLSFINRIHFLSNEIESDFLVFRRRGGVREGQRIREQCQAIEMKVIWEGQGDGEETCPMVCGQYATCHRRAFYRVIFLHNSNHRCLKL